MFVSWNAWAAACSFVSFFPVRLCCACTQPWCLVHTGTTYRSSALQEGSAVGSSRCDDRLHHQDCKPFQIVHILWHTQVKRERCGSFHLPPPPGAAWALFQGWLSAWSRHCCLGNWPVVKSEPRMTPWVRIWRVSRACVRVGCCYISKFLSFNTAESQEQRPSGKTNTIMQNKPGSQSKHWHPLLSWQRKSLLEVFTQSESCRIGFAVRFLGFWGFVLQSLFKHSGQRRRLFCLFVWGFLSVSMTFKGLKSLLCVKYRKGLNEQQMRGNRLRKIRAICYQRK